MTSRPFDAEAMARATVYGYRSYSPELIRRIAAALQSLHDAHEAEVRGLYRLGQEDMRERAASTADHREYSVETPDHQWAKNGYAGQKIAREIRALALKDRADD